MSVTMLSQTSYVLSAFLVHFHSIFSAFSAYAMLSIHSCCITLYLRANSYYMRISYSRGRAQRQRSSISGPHTFFKKNGLLVHVWMCPKPRNTCHHSVSLLATLLRRQWVSLLLPLPRHGRVSRTCFFSSRVEISSEKQSFPVQVSGGMWYIPPSRIVSDKSCTGLRIP